MSRILAILMCLGLLFLVNVPADEKKKAGFGTGKGEFFPDIKFPTLDGEQASLADYRGKKVLLIHFASW